MSKRDPILLPTPLDALRPTQMTVGFREVEAKRRQWRARVEKKGADRDGPEFLGRHMIPVLRGPKDRLYVIDHHHLSRALQLEGVTEVAVNVVADLSGLSQDEFWVYCDNKALCHPYDAEGLRRDFASIPKRIDKLTDDPFRSLAGELRRAGGYSKETTPFSEFIWADFLRRRLKRKLVDADFNVALEKALALSKAQGAQHLPGWCGPSTDD